MKTNSPDLLLLGEVLVWFSPINIKAYPLLALIEGRLTLIKKEITYYWWNYHKLSFIDNFSFWRRCRVRLGIFNGHGFYRFILDIDRKESNLLLIVIKNFKIIELVISLSENHSAVDDWSDFFGIVPELMFIINLKGHGLVVDKG